VLRLASRPISSRKSTRLTDGDAGETELAERFPISRPAISVGHAMRGEIR
jgi:hypothetical protein